MRLYLDSSPIVYLVEQQSPYAAKVLARIGLPGVILASSDLAPMEALVVPLRQNNAQLATDFGNFFSVQIAQRIAFTEPVFRKAADIRARFNYRTPDALHLAAAVTSACDIFLTNDARLKNFPDITVELVS
jgi:uncharacterized protein